MQTGLERRLAAALAIVVASCATARTDTTPSQAGVRSAPPGAGGSIDFAALDRLVGDAKLVVLGEDSHRMPAVHKLAATLFRHLVEEKGFRTLVFESAWGVEDAMNAFLASDRKTLTREESYFLNVFASESTTELLLWARAYNAAHPGDPVRFAGYQPEQPVTDAAALRAFADRASALDRPLLDATLDGCDLTSGKYANDMALIVAQGSGRPQGKPAYTPERRAACLQGLDKVVRAIDGERAQLERQTSRATVREAELHLSSIRLFVGTLSEYGDNLTMGGSSKERLGELTAKAYLDIDRGRFEIFEGLQQTRDRRGKVFFWMHNWHAARHAQAIDLVHDGRTSHAVSLGERLSGRYGDDLVVMATIVPCENCGEPAGSLEPAFAKHFGERVAVVNFKNAAEGLPIHTPGVLFAQYHRAISAWLGNVVLGTQFDGAIYLPDPEALP